jgi:hypothetical protein
MKQIRDYWGYFLPIWLYPIVILNYDEAPNDPPRLVMAVMPLLFLIAAIPYFRKHLSASETLIYSSPLMLTWIIGIVIKAIVNQT